MIDGKRDGKTERRKDDVMSHVVCRMSHVVCRVSYVPLADHEPWAMGDERVPE